MAEEKDTMWDINPHTLAKHEILQEYLKAWFPILSRYAGRIIYLDGFAGPGEYSKGEEGSPVIAIRIAHEHYLKKQLREIIFWFIEKEKDRAEKLEETLKKKFQDLPSNLKYEVEKSEFAPSLSVTLDKLEKEGVNLAPTFAFIDPFGFSGLPMNVIARMLSYKKCEVLITFMSGFAFRFTDGLRREAFNELFGTDSWTQVNNLNTMDEKINFLLNLYVNQLKSIGGAKYVRTFEMRDKNNRHLYHLVFGTKHWKGLEVMKEAMVKVDKRGMFRFSDKTDVNQTFLLDYSNEEWWVSGAANFIFNNFKGKTVSVEDVHEYVAINTPYIFRKKILQFLEKSRPQKIVKVEGRKIDLTFPDKCRITFSDV